MEDQRRDVQIIKDKIGEWTSMSFALSQRAVEDRDRWGEVIAYHHWCPNALVRKQNRKEGWK